MQNSVSFDSLSVDITGGPAQSIKPIHDFVDQNPPVESVKFVRKISPL